VVVVHNGIAVPDEPAPPPGLETLRIVCIARLAASKGQETLLRALSIAGPGIEAELAGDDLEQGGRYRRALEQLARELGLDGRVRFLGHRSDVDELLREADALVLPSVLEGLPIAVLEAMAYGRPVIATAAGGTPELVRDGETGLLVGWDDAGGLATALGRLRDDVALRRRLGRAGRERVEREFTLERMVERTLAVYETVV
jgi:glycosyltransferase involved in cell wall biosynthesis